MKIGDERTAEEIMIGVLRQQLEDTKEWLATRSEQLATRSEQLANLRKELAAARRVVEVARPLGAAMFIDITVQDEARYQIRKAITAYDAVREEKK